MHGNEGKHRTAVIVTVAVAALILLDAGAVAAHGGHEHAGERGFDPTVLFQVGGTAIAAITVYLLASRIYRWREGRDG